MAVKDWITEFLDRHKARFDPHDWPAADAPDERLDFVRGWITAFSLKEVGEKEADEASRRLTISPPNFRREHIPMVLHALEQIRAERNPVTAGGTREAARDASRSCPHCGGEGLATAYHPFPDPEQRVSATSAAYCVCHHGRLIRRIHGEKEPELLRRIPDLDLILNGASVYLAEPPRHAADPAAIAPAAAVPARRNLGSALQYLVGMLAVKPTPLRTILEGAREFRISHGAVFEAAGHLEVIKTTVEGEETWDLQQGRGS